MSPTEQDTPLTFWGHLDVLRQVLWRCLLAVAVTSLAVFFGKDWIFGWILAPCNPDFLTYRWLNTVTGAFADFRLQLISTELSAQFQAHLQIALELGLLLASPFILWQLFGFIAPALYEKERHFAGIIFPATYLLFFTGIIVNYFLLFPIALHFLGTYQVSETITNSITLSSYINSFTSMTFTMGLIFELPVVIWLLGKTGLMSAATLRHYRRHAFVAIMILAAFVTPPDIFTMFLVTVPLYLLFEVSIHLIK